MVALPDHPSPTSPPAVDPTHTADGALEPQPAQGFDALALTILLSLCLLLGLALLLASSC